MGLTLVEDLSAPGWQTAWRRLTWRPGKQEEAISGLEDRGETSEQSEWRGGHVGELNLPNGKRKGGGEKGR